MVRPGYELRLTTAFTVSRVKRGINKLDPPPLTIKKEGRLLKAKLKPLYPVKVCHIYQFVHLCKRGIVHTSKFHGG